MTDAELRLEMINQVWWEWRLLANGMTVTLPVTEVRWLFSRSHEQEDD